MAKFKRRGPRSSPPKLPKHGTARAIGRKRAQKRDAPAISSSARPPAPDDALAELDDGRVRLNKLLADHGIASRRKCDELIAKGKVMIDGEPVTELGTKVDPDKQAVEVDGVVLRSAGRRYYLLNKPSGVVCTNEEREMRPRAVDLITDRAKGRIYTVGRLDEESTGLILLTNDGDFANRVMHPRYGVDKTYAVRVAGRIEDEALDEIRNGVHLAEGRTSGARILVKRRGYDHSMLEITLREGMNREIRRVFARFGYKVTTLRRVRIGPLTARGVKVGHWRKLTRGEVEALLTWGEARPEAPAPMGPGRPGHRSRKTAGGGRRKAAARGGHAARGEQASVPEEGGRTQSTGRSRRAARAGGGTNPRGARGRTNLGASAGEVSRPRRGGRAGGDGGASTGQGARGGKGGARGSGGATGGRAAARGKSTGKSTKGSKSGRAGGDRRAR